MSNPYQELLGTVIALRRENTALRAEVSSLTVERDSARRFNGVERTASEKVNLDLRSKLEAAAAERDLLRAEVERLKELAASEPHDARCWIVKHPTHPTTKCTCWKAKFEAALNETANLSATFEKGAESMRERAEAAVNSLLHLDGSPDGCECPSCYDLRKAVNAIRALPLKV